MDGDLPLRPRHGHPGHRARDQLLRRASGAPEGNTSIARTCVRGGTGSRAGPGTEHRCSCSCVELYASGDGDAGEWYVAAAAAMTYLVLDNSISTLIMRAKRIDAFECG